MAVEELLRRWPALFTSEEINLEFQRVTTVPLQSRFLAALDNISPKVVAAIENRGGVVREKTRKLMAAFNSDVDIKRECVLRALIWYLGEDEPTLIKDYLISQHEEAERELELCTIAIYTTRSTEDLLDPPHDIGVIIEDYTEILKSMMTQIGLSIAELHPAAPGKEEPVATESIATPSEPQVNVRADHLPPSSTSVTEPGTEPAASKPGVRRTMSSIDVHPPEVQRYVVEHIVKSEEGAGHHQRLRAFSGRLPRPAHESDYETWRTGVDLLMKDPSVSDLQRSRRIVESLLPPAADVVKHLSSDTMPTVYLDTLDSAYGTVQDGDELFAKFMDTFQDNGEKPSAYLQRLQVVLNSALKRGGVIESDIDRHLLNQFCRGCWDNTLITELQLKQKKTQPPTFPQLLLLLRTEEDREAAKATRMKQHLGSARPKATAHAQFARSDPVDGGTVAALTTMTQQLAQQLADVQRQLAMLTANLPGNSKSSLSNKSSIKDKSKVQSSRRFTKPGYCFRSVPVEGQMGAKRDQTRPKKEKKSVKCAEMSQSKKSMPNRLPKGLVGSKCSSVISIAGRPHHCLLDTGSQVTTVPVSVYNQSLSEQPVKPLDSLLQVEGAAGQSVPYLGYVEVTLTFPEDFLGVEFEVPTLALVVPDAHLDCPSPVLIGMNTLEPLYEQYLSSDVSNFQPVAQGYCAVLKLLQLNYQQSQEGTAGTVRLLGQTPVLVPAGQTVVLEGSARLDNPSAVQWAVVEHPTSPLPGGLCVQSCLITLPTRAPYKVPVVIRNESEQDALIPPLTVIADIATSPTILTQPTVNHLTTAAKSKRSSLEFNFGDSPVPTEWKERITATLNQMPEVFSQHDLDFGCTDRVKHNIKLHDETPFKQRARPIHPRDIEAVRSHLRDLLAAGVIRESESPFASPIVVVRKRNGDVRLCIDYRKLNLQTVKDAYALPNLEESFSALTGSKWFTVLDLKSGYYQIQMDEADKAKTAFVTPLGFWEWNRMPQGVTNAPSTFQRLMEKCMGDLNLKEVLVFLDDIIIFSDTLEEHEKRLLRVLNRLKQYGLKLSPEKCKFLQSSVRYLGHVVSEKGVETDPEKISSLKSWPVPRNLKELRSFLGFAGYYRRFIRDYATIVKPLNVLTRGYAPLHRSTKDKPPTVKYLDPKQSFGDRWTPECLAAFNLVIEKLTSAPVLGFANPKLPYILHTDASTTGLGAVLYQEQESQLRVIAYASRGLSQSESRYPAHKLEFLALKWSVTEKFHDYLYGANFTVVTDNNPLTYVLSSAKLDATSHRWLAALSTYSFKMQYRAGRHNYDADALSRRCHAEVSDDVHSRQEWDSIHQLAEQLSDPGEAAQIAPDIVHAVCQSSLTRAFHQSESTQSDITLVESLTVSTEVLPAGFIDEQLHGLPVLPSLTPSDLREEQSADPALQEIIHQLKTGEKAPPSLREELPEFSLLLREWNRLELEDGVLYRRRQEGDKVSLQLVLPPALRSVVLKSLHSDMGHMGIERTLDLVRQRFFWPKMAANVEHFVKTCGRCIRRKTPPERAAPLVNIQTTRPLELLCIDFLSLEPDSSNTKDILVLTDHFTKFAVAIPTPNQKAKTVAKCLWNDFMVYYGIPERLHSDQGPDFESRLIKEFCEVAGIKKTRTTPYHPRGNPVERFNRTLLSMLGTLENKQKSKWKEYVKPLVHAYNCTRNEVTGFTPYELLFGRSPRLPVDLAFGLPVRESPSPSHSQYVKSLKERLEECYKLASQNAQKSAQKNKSRFDQRVKPASLEAGDRVLVRNVRIRGKHKLEDKWEQEVYVVVRRAGDLPVYIVKPETRDGPTRTLHRDLLLPCGFLPTAVEDLDESTPARRPLTRSQSRQSASAEHDQGSEEEEEVTHILEPPPLLPTKFSVERSCEPEPMPTETVATDSDPSSPSPSENLPTTIAPETYLPETVETPVAVEEPLTSSTESDAPEEAVENPENNLPELENLPVEREILTSVPEERPPDVGLPEPEAEDPETVQSESSEGDAGLRRSGRHRQPPQRLRYSVLGNPLISVVQALFHSLSNAYAEALSHAPAADIIRRT
ncbi:hypothetical protein WMY93_025622 [Mugilogobius chulae]|uniref:Gypsy retrotransposon integrase-like protein 1 n=1 Tax=Mugilogobius chulae TaxID=88201 RepID=A0AAW0N5H7_9GOBI